MTISYPVSEKVICSASYTFRNKSRSPIRFLAAANKLKQNLLPFLLSVVNCHRRTVFLGLRVFSELTTSFQTSRTRRGRGERTMKRVFGVKKNKDPPPSVQDASDRVNLSSSLNKSRSLRKPFNF